MNKDFSGRLQEVIQPVPADLLLDNIDHSEESETSKRLETAQMLQKAFKIIDMFEELDPTSKTIVLEKLKEIACLDQANFPTNELTVEQAASFLGVSDRTIRNYLKNGRIQGIKKGKRWFFAKDDLQKLLVN